MLLLLLVFNLFFSFDVWAVDPACDIALLNKGDRKVLEEMHALKVDILNTKSRVDHKILEEKFSKKVTELA